jgi:hypothetical protein
MQGYGWYNKHMQDQQVVDYIRQRVKRGDAELDIRRELEKAGWSPVEIELAWEDATTGPVISVHDPLPGDQPPEAIAKSDRKTRHRKIWFNIAKVVIILAILAAGGFWLWHRTHTPKVAYSTGGSSPNSLRQDDASLIAEAITTYIGNNGTLPQLAAADTTNKTLDICGKACDSMETTTQLYHYNPEAVSYRAYNSGLKVPDTETVYIVNGADCNKDDSALGAQAASGHDAVAILYALAESADSQQKCLSLQGDHPVSP